MHAAWPVNPPKFRTRQATRHFSKDGFHLHSPPRFPAKPAASPAISRHILPPLPCHRIAVGCAEIAVRCKRIAADCKRVAMECNSIAACCNQAASHRRGSSAGRAMAMRSTAAQRRPVVESLALRATGLAARGRPPTATRLQHSARGCEERTTSGSHYTGRYCRIGIQRHCFSICLSSSRSLRPNSVGLRR